MRVPNVVVIGVVLLTLLAIGMQCEDSEARAQRLARRRERRMRELPGQQQRVRGRRHRTRVVTTTIPDNTESTAEQEEEEQPVAPRTQRGQASRRHQATQRRQRQQEAQRLAEQQLQGDSARPSRLASSESQLADGSYATETNDTSRNDTTETVASNRNETNEDVESNSDEGSEHLMAPEQLTGSGHNAGDGAMDDPNMNLTMTTEATLSPHNWANRQRARNLRLFMFQKELLRRLGIRVQPPYLPPNMFHGSENVKLQDLLLGNGLLTESDPLPAPDQRTDFQNHLPSCEVPRRCNEGVWYDETKFRLFFAMAKDRSHDTNVTSAVLKLYKRPLEDCNCRGNTAQPRNSRRRSARDRPNRRSRRDHRREEDDPVEEEAAPTQANEPRINIKILKYTRPLKPNKRIHTRLINATKVDASFEGWVNFDILPAVKSWKKTPNKNFGLTVEAYLNRSPVQASRLFDSFNCSATSNVTILPNPFRLAVFETSDNDTIVYNINQTYPNLGVVTVYSMRQSSPQPLRRKRTPTSHQTLHCVLQERLLPVAETIKEIISPSQVDAGVCVVRGPGNMRMTHPVCAPASYTPLHIVYVDSQGNTESGSLDSIIINRCEFKTGLCTGDDRGFCL